MDNCFDITYKDCVKKLFVEERGDNITSFSFANVSREQERIHLISELQFHKTWLEGWGVWTDFTRNDSFRNVKEEFRRGNRYEYDKAWLLNIQPQATSFVSKNVGTKVATCYIIGLGSSGKGKGKWNILYSDYCAWRFLMCEKLKTSLIREFNTARSVTRDNLLHITNNLMAMGNINSRYDSQRKELFMSYIVELDSPVVYGKMVIHDEKEMHEAVAYLQRNKSFPPMTLISTPDEALLCYPGNHTVTLVIEFPEFITDWSRIPRSVKNVHSLQSPITEKGAFEACV